MYQANSLHVRTIAYHNAIITLVMATVALLLCVTCSQAVESSGKAGASPHLKTIIVDNYHPYTFLNDKGQPDGFSIEIARAVTRAMDLELEIRVDKWDQAMKELEAGNIDLLPIMAHSHERDKLFDFSVPYTTAYDAIFLRKGTTGIRSLKDLSGKTVIVINRDIAHSYLLSSGLSKNMKLIAVDSPPESLQLLSAGKADAAIMPKLVGIITAKKMNFSDIETSPKLIDAYTRPFSIAVKDGNQVLLERLNQGLNIIKSSGEYDAIYKKWFGALEDSHLNLKTALKYGSFAALLLLGFIAWDVILKRQVMAKTEHLKAEILQRKRSEAALRESEERFRSILDNAPIGMAIVSLEGRFNLVNRSLCEIVGYPKEELEKLTFQEISHPEDLNSDLANLQRLLEGGDNSYTMEKRYFRKDHEIVWIQLTVSVVRDSNGLPLYFISQIEDITARKQTETALKESNRKFETLSSLDGLTGIANRRRFDELLSQEYARHARSGATLSLIMLDIDHFKEYNDQYGHVQGDECLREISRVISGCLTRPADLAARYGGEEFICLLPETRINGAVTIAEKIRRSILACAIPHKGSNVEPYVTASLGVASVRCKAEEAAVDIITKVDELLYRAKSSGRNRVEYSEPLLGPEQNDISLLKISWNESYSCGNHLIDSQHQSLFQLANKLLEAIILERPKDIIYSMVTHLLDDAAQHFRDEEQVLESVGFPNLKLHAEGHAKLLQKGRELAQEFQLVELTLLGGDLFQFLVHDLVLLNMIEADREFLPFTNGANPISDSSI